MTICGGSLGGAVIPESFEGLRFLAELRTFLAFLSGLWGALAGLSLLFPVANVSLT